MQERPRRRAAMVSPFECEPMKTRMLRSCRSRASCSAASSFVTPMAPDSLGQHGFRALHASMCAAYGRAGDNLRHWSESLLCLPPSAFCLPPSAFRFPPSAFCLLPSAFRLLPSAFRLQPPASSLQPPASSLRTPLSSHNRCIASLFVASACGQGKEYPLSLFFCNALIRKGIRLCGPPPVNTGEKQENEPIRSRFVPARLVLCHSMPRCFYHTEI